jgi:hypothetical protein
VAQPPGPLLHHDPTQPPQWTIRIVLQPDRRFGAGLIAEATGQRLAELVKAAFYPLRGYRMMVEAGRAAGLPAAELDALAAWLPGNRVDRKRADAIAMLAATRDRALVRYLAVQRVAVAPPPDDAAVRGVAEGFRRERDLLEPDQARQWLAGQHLTLHQFAALMREEHAIGQALRAADTELGIYLRSQLRVDGLLGRLDQTVATPGGRNTLVIEAQGAKIFATNNEISWADLGDTDDATMRMTALR